MKYILTFFLISAVCAAHSQTDSAVYYNTVITAMYPGGDMAFARYVKANTKFPEEAQSKLIAQGTVVVKFMVDSLGKSHDVSAVSGPEELRAEAVRLIKNVDVWVPGIVRVPALNNSVRANTWKFQSVLIRN
ncbi:MAG TPA: energy transducer TonB [Puia sp.]|nr:energy transducer TonB [Puia sp.]